MNSSKDDRTEVSITGSMLGLYTIVMFISGMYVSALVTSIALAGLGMLLFAESRKGSRTSWKDRTHAIIFGVCSFLNLVSWIINTPVFG